MDGHDRLLAAFLAGDLDPAETLRWDEHLLVCERCWRAVREDRAGGQAAQVLRQPAPPGLADRVTFAVEVAAAADTAAQRPARPGFRSRRRARHDRRPRGRSWPGSDPPASRWPHTHPIPSTRYPASSVTHACRRPTPASGS